jgi:hypothetical protein
MKYNFSKAALRDSDVIDVASLAADVKSMCYQFPVIEGLKPCLPVLQMFVADLASQFPQGVAPKDLHPRAADNLLVTMALYIELAKYSTLVVVHLPAPAPGEQPQRREP